MNTFINILIVLCAVAGFRIAFFIYYKKKRSEVMVCPLKSDCNAVVKSDYSKFLGIPVEIIGLFYYGVIAIFYSLSLFQSFSINNLVFFLILISTFGAFLFSIYLTFIQIFNLKQFCTWCLTSAGLCITIFILVISANQFNFLQFFTQYNKLFVILHLFGAALGLGTATATDFLFFKFLKDFKISESESSIIKTLSQLIWLALIIIVITGVFIYISDSQRFNETPKFLVKMIIIFIIIVNGAFLNLLIAPKLIKISFEDQNLPSSSKMNIIRKVAFALGSISIVSWYSSFLLGTLKKVELGFLEIFSIYLMLVLVAIVISQFIERYFVKKFKNRSN